MFTIFLMSWREQLNFVAPGRQNSKYGPVDDNSDIISL